MRRAVLLAVLTLCACSGPTNGADEYEVGAPKFYTVVDPDDPHLVFEDGTRMGVDGVPAGEQIDIGSLTATRKKKPKE